MDVDPLETVDHPDLFEPSEHRHVVEDLDRLGVIEQPESEPTLTHPLAALPVEGAAEAPAAVVARIPAPAPVSEAAAAQAEGEVLAAASVPARSVAAVSRPTGDHGPTTLPPAADHQSEASNFPGWWVVAAAEQAVSVTDEAPTERPQGFSAAAEQAIPGAGETPPESLQPSDFQLQADRHDFEASQRDLHELVTTALATAPPPRPDRTPAAPEPPEAPANGIVPDESDDDFPPYPLPPKPARYEIF
jgi:hypothetical protein